VIFLKKICLAAVFLFGLTALLNAAAPAHDAMATTATAAHGAAAGAAAAEEHHRLPSAAVRCSTLARFP